MRKVTAEDIAHAIYDDQDIGYLEGHPPGHPDHQPAYYIDGVIDCNSMAAFINARIGEDE